MDCCLLVTALCLTFATPWTVSPSGSSVLHYIPEFAHIRVHRVADAIYLFLHPFSFCLQSFPAGRSFPMSQLFTSGGQNSGASVLATVLPMNFWG